MRICYVIPTLNIGGTERQLLYLVNGLAADHRIVIVCTRNAGDLAGEAAATGATVEELRLRGGWDPRQSFRLRRVFRAFKPDIVHTFLFGFDLAANRAARRCNVPVVISSRRELATWMRPRHVRLQRKANALVDCIVANSNAAAQFAQETESAPEALFRVIPNGIDAAAFGSRNNPMDTRSAHAMPANGHIIGAVANLSPVKDYPLFLAIANELLRRRSDVHFLIIGDGPLRSWLDTQIAAPHWAKHFTRIAATAGVADLLGVMDILLHCAKSEGFPNAVMEAMAEGKAVVAAAVGGIPELIDDRVHGRLIASRNASDFADAIDELLGSATDRAALGRNAAARIHGSFTVARMVHAHQRLYTDLMAHRNPQGRQ